MTDTFALSSPLGARAWPRPVPEQTTALAPLYLNQTLRGRAALLTAKRKDGHFFRVALSTEVHIIVAVLSR